MADASLVDRFQHYLREHKLPVTAQRLAIARLLQTANRHVSAEDVSAALATAGHAAGVATVYRTLDLLVASGLAAERDFGEGFKRFEASDDRPNHYHLTCGVCGAAVEFFDDQIGEVIRRTASRSGFVPSGHQLVVNGTCRSCRRTPKIP